MRHSRKHYVRTIGGAPPAPSESFASVSRRIPVLYECPLRNDAESGLLQVLGQKLGYNLEPHNIKVNKKQNEQVANNGIHQIAEKAVSR